MSDAAELSPGRTLWEALGDIPDRRGAKGRRYPLRSVLTLSLAAMLAGGNDLCSIFRWGRRLPPEALYLLGLKRAPCHAMYHYFYKALDVAATEQVLGAWAQGSGPLGTVAIDGKRLRGSAPAGHDGSEGVHVVAAFASQLGAVIGQVAKCRWRPRRTRLRLPWRCSRACRWREPSSPETRRSASGRCARACATARGTTCSP
jgi:hypothetical protein